MIRNSLFIALFSAVFFISCAPKNDSSSINIDDPNLGYALIGIENTPIVEDLPVRSAYLPFGRLRNGSHKASEMVAALSNTSVNAIVLDLKEAGIHFKAHEVSKVQTDWSEEEEEMITDTYDSHMQDSEALFDAIKIFKDAGYRVILRHVVFNDEKLARTHNELAIEDTEGGLWGKHPWVNPYLKKVRKYNIEVVLRALKKSEQLGLSVDEIQLDYIRFPDALVDVDGYRTIHFPLVEENSEDIGATTDSFENRCLRIAKFLEDFKTEVKSRHENVDIGIDVFGYVAAGSNRCHGIGQRVNEMAKHVDVIYPMQYPSHWAQRDRSKETDEDRENGVQRGRKAFGSEHPETIPQKVYRITTKSLRNQLYPEDQERIKIVPWVQAFTIGYFGGKKMLRPTEESELPEYVAEQIAGIMEGGGHGFALWTYSRTNQKNSMEQVNDFLESIHSESKED